VIGYSRPEAEVRHDLPLLLPSAGIGVRPLATFERQTMSQLHRYPYNEFMLDLPDLTVHSYLELR